MSKSKPARPYVRDAVRASHDEVDGAKGRLGKPSIAIGFVLLALVVGFVIGFAVYAVMNLSTWLTERLWGFSGTFALFPLVVCTVGGVIIGLWTYWSRDEVQPLEVVMREFKQTGSYRTNGVVRPVVSFLLPLVFGGSIGFEAGLTGLITSGCCWIRDQLKRAGLRLADVTEVTLAACLSAIFKTPLVGIAVGLEDGTGTNADVDAYDMRRGAKAVLYIAAAFGAFGGIRLFSSLFGASGGLPRFEGITASLDQLPWVVPCLVVAYLMALLFHGANKLFGAVSTRLRASDTGLIVCPVICGVVLGSMACVLPYVLFPGETQSEELMETWTTWTAVTLLGTGVAKAVMTPLCINMGWVGGDFFPSIFAGVAAGYGLAALTGVDPMLMVTVTATAYLAGVTRKPLMVLGILFLCFPAGDIIWMGIAAVLGATLPMPASLLDKE